MDFKGKKMKFTIYLDGAIMVDISSFYQQINAQLMQDEDWQLAESLDALDDLLYGGYSKWKDYGQLEIVWKDIVASKLYLGVDTTRSYYEAKLGSDKPYDQNFVKERVRQLDEGIGQTYFDMLIEIIESHKDKVTLIKR